MKKVLLGVLLVALCVLSAFGGATEDLPPKNSGGIFSVFLHIHFSGSVFVPLNDAP